jgi:ufm1-conjugating enzyme 1
MSNIVERLKKIPTCSVNASPKDSLWIERLKEEYNSLIKFVASNQESGDDWFNIQSNNEGTKFYFN